MADGSPWWVVAAAAVPSAASGLWVAWQWWIKRGDERQTVALTREQALMRDLDAQRAAATADAKMLFDRVQAELARRDAESARKDIRIDALEADRDRGWDLARWWHRKAHDMKHVAANAQAMADALLLRAEMPVEVHPPLDLPALEGPT